jgi:hypothetical protein
MVSRSPRAEVGSAGSCQCLRFHGSSPVATSLGLGERSVNEAEELPGWNCHAPRPDGDLDLLSPSLRKVRKVRGRAEGLVIFLGRS